MAQRVRFDGWIAGVGTTSGTRLVLGHWPGSPFGPVSDVMIEDATGHRTLVATSRELADFVAATYQFDEVRVATVEVRRAGTRRTARPGTGVHREHDHPTGTQWSVTAGLLRYEFTAGPRAALGRLLRAVPSPLAGVPAWVRLIDLPARVVMPGVRTHGSAGNGRYEWYGARDLHPIVAASAEFDGTDLGTLTPIDPPVRFGFGSTPRDPSLVRITTTVAVPDRPGRRGSPDRSELTEGS